MLYRGRRRIRDYSDWPWAGMSPRVPDPDEPATGALTALAAVLVMAAACLGGLAVAVWWLK